MVAIEPPTINAKLVTPNVDAISTFFTLFMTNSLLVENAFAEAIKAVLSKKLKIDGFQSKVFAVFIPPDNIRQIIPGI